MPGSNLTREEARARAALLEVASYQVALDLTGTGPTFPSTTRLRFACRQPGAATFVDLIAPAVRRVVLNGRSLDPAAVFDGTRIALDDLAANNELEVVADAAYMHTGEGLHRFTDPVDGAAYLYTQFEVADARRVYACFEQPDLKATLALTVDAPAGWTVVSNQPTPEPEPLGGGPARWRFAPTPPLSTYVTALVAGPYHRVTGEVTSSDGRPVPLGVFCRRSLAEYLDAEAVLDVTRRGFAFFEEHFGLPYPFTKYDQLFVPEFNAGAMENAGCVTILEDYVFRSKTTDAAYERRAVTILHELAHMWFGDLVTMRWWDDLWLNESFAEYVSTLALVEATRWTHGWTTFAQVEKTWAYRQDQLPSTHPVVADIRDLEDVEVNFDGITYAKGAAVLKQLVAWVGRENFFAGLQRYFRAHAYGNTSLADLLAALEQTSGRDLSAWSRQWLQTAGVTTLRPAMDTGADGHLRSFAVLQEPPPVGDPAPRSHRVVIGLYDRTEAGLVRRERVELDVEGARTEVPALVGVRRPDLVLCNDEDQTYAKLRLDERSLATLRAAIGEFTDSLARTQCWAAAWDMTRDAELPARDYLDLVCGGVAREGDIAVAQLLLRQAQTAGDLYVHPEHRPAAQDRLADRLAELARAAAPGSDHQLAFVRSLATVATAPAHLAWLAALLDGEDTLHGLSVDTDLRWQLLKRLVATGVRGDDAVDAELARDDTATGRRHATEARAARPTAAAKAQAWADAVERDDLPNALLSATIAGFVQPHQRDLLAPYVEPYFAAVDEVWRSRTNDTAQTIVVGLYPTLLASPDLVARTDAYLAGGSPPPALRRLVLEGRDGVLRALRAQARDGQGPTAQPPPS